MAHITRIVYVGFGLIAIIALCGGIIAFIMRGIESLASFEVGFIGLILIVGSSFATLLKRIKAQKIGQEQKQSQETTLNPAQNTQSQSPQEQDKVQFSTRFTMGAQMSLSFLRILSYVLFALMLVALFEYRLFALSWFFAGLCAAMIVLVGLGLLGIAKAKS